MRNLLAFLLKNHFFLYFVFLEVICFMLLFQSSGYQRASIFNTSNAITGGLNKTYDNITAYFQLGKENEILARQNAELITLITADSMSRQKYPQADTQYHFISAKVISNSIHTRNNYFMIDKGKNDGIGQDMGVISPGGVAGIVIATSKDYSVCMSLLHKDSRISGRIKKNNQLVNVVWNGVHYTTGVVEDIPTHILLNPGDTIITSGNSHIFPEGIHLGYVKNYLSKGEGLFDKARLLFATDFNSLYYVYVIQNIKREDLLDFYSKTVSDDER